MSFKVPGNSRLTKAWFVTRGQEHLLQLASSPADGNNGAFLVRRRGGKRFFCIVSDGFGWEHVSVSLRRGDLSTFPRTPTWEETCLIKALFWDAEDTVVQYHPAGIGSRTHADCQVAALNDRIEFHGYSSPKTPCKCLLDPIVPTGDAGRQARTARG